MNRGTVYQPLFGGGFHAAYDPKKWANNKISILPAIGLPITPRNRAKTPDIPAPGPHLYQIANGVFWGYGEDGTKKIVTDEDSLKEIKGYQQGPCLVSEDKPHGKTVAFVSGRAGAGWVPRACNNLKQYYALFGGENKLGARDGSWHGANDKNKLALSNMAPSPFTPPPRSSEDTIAAIANPSMILTTALQGVEGLMEEVLADVTFGASELILQIPPLRKAIDDGLSKLGEAGGKDFEKLTGMDKAAKPWTEYDNLFDAPPPASAPDSTGDNFERDPRIKASMDEFLVEKKKLDETKAQLEQSEDPADKQLLSKLKQMTTNFPVDASERYAHNRLSDLHKQLAALKTVNARIPIAQKVIADAHNIVKISPELGEHYKSGLVGNTLDYVVPRDNMDEKQQEKVFQSFVGGSADELERTFTRSQKLALQELDAYRDKSAGLGQNYAYDQAMLGSALTFSENQRLEQLQKEGNMTEDDVYRYKRQKLRAYQYRREQAGERTKVKSNFTDEYKRFVGAQMKQDKLKGKFFDAKYLVGNDEEFERMKKLDLKYSGLFESPKSTQDAPAAAQT